MLFLIISYFIMGLIVTFISIYAFRRDGTTDQPGELYLSAIAPLIWPIVACKLIPDLSSYLIKNLKKKIQKSYKLNSITAINECTDINFLEKLLNEYIPIDRKNQSLTPSELDKLENAAKKRLEFLKSKNK